MGIALSQWIDRLAIQQLLYIEGWIEIEFVIDAIFSTGKSYLKSESWEVIRARVDCLLEARCEQFAFRILVICQR